MTAKPAPGRPDFERIALLLQGGGALGSYQAGVYQALAEADLHPDCVAGISIGAINSAIIAGNPAAERVAKLRRFWETVCSPPLGIPDIGALQLTNDFQHQMINQWRAFGILLWGAPSFSQPRIPPPLFTPAAAPDRLGFYDTKPLKGLLESLVDFDRINAQETRFGVGAVNIKTGNFIYFENQTHKIAAEHIMASGALPPGFPAIEVDGDYYWDGGIVSNTPLQWLLDGMHPELRQTPEAELLAQEADSKVYNIVHLIYHARRYEGSSKDYEFSRRTMEEHWQSGYSDMERTLRHPEILQRPQSADGVFTFDLKTQGRQ